MSEAVTFAIVGAIIFFGFIGTKFFQRTKISEVLILILLGFLLGPVFMVVDPTTLVNFVPFFAGVALIILLFDGGLNLNFYKVLHEFAPASVFTILVFLLSMALIGVVTHFLLGWSLLISFMFAAVVSGTSSPIVITLVNSVRVKEEVKTMLSLESALTDALTIVTAIALANIIVSNSFEVTSAINAVAGAFSIAAVIGLIIGAIWINFLKQFSGKFDYMLTIAVAFLLYGAVEFIHANGGIAVLVFGIVLGNAKQLVQMITQQVSEKNILPKDFLGFQEEISFFVRTFFFIYIGLLLTVKALTPLIIAGAVAITIAALLARFLIAKLLGYARKPGGTLIATMMPRGLAAAVMSTIPATYGIKAPGFTELVMLVIIGSNILTTIGVFKSEKEFSSRKPVVVKVSKTKGT